MSPKGSWNQGLVPAHCSVVRLLGGRQEQRTLSHWRNVLEGDPTPFLSLSLDTIR